MSFPQNSSLPQIPKPTFTPSNLNTQPSAINLQPNSGINIPTVIAPNISTQSINVPNAIRPNIYVPIPNIGAIPQPNIGTIPTPNIGTIPQPNIGTIPTPNIGTIPNPNVGNIPQPNIGNIPTPNVGNIPQPNIGNIPTPNVGTIPTPNVGTIPTPNVGTIPRPNIGNIPTPNVGNIPRPNIGNVSTPNVGTIPRSNIGNVPTPNIGRQILGSNMGGSRPVGGVLSQFGEGGVNLVTLESRAVATPTINIDQETGLSILLQTLNSWKGTPEQAQILANLQYYPEDESPRTLIVDINRKDIIMEIIGMLTYQSFDEVLHFLNDAPNPEFILWEQDSDLIIEGKNKVSRELDLLTVQESGVKGIGKCRYCTSTELVYTQRQQRSGDELANVYVRCVLCGKNWRQT